MELPDDYLVVGNPKMTALKFKNKCTYNPKELEMIYKQFGDTSD